MPDRKSLLVESIDKGGLVHQWNMGCATCYPRDCIRRGDRIIWANNVQGDSQALEGALATGDGLIRIYVERPAAGRGNDPTNALAWALVSNMQEGEADNAS